MHQPTVFLCHDYVLAEMLEDIRRRLEGDGLRVIRGPETTPGTKLVYHGDSLARLFGAADVAMFSSRSIASREVLCAAPRLRGIVNPTIGVETIDLAAAGELGIVVANGATPENYTGMAEATVMLMLMLLYQPRKSEDVLHGRRPRPPATPQHAPGRLLRSRTVGLVGMGRIARAVVERLAGFGVRVLAHDPWVAQEAAPAGVTMAGLDALLAGSDIVSLHVSLTREARGLIGARELALMKRTAYLVNTSRGEAVDEHALYRALLERRIAGAALDCYVVEPLPQDSLLRGLDNVILTPHMVGHTREMYASFPAAAVENISRILRGEPPLYCANPEVLPRWRERLARLAAEPSLRPS